MRFAVGFLGLVLLACPPSHADEGMWLPGQLAADGQSLASLADGVSADLLGAAAEAPLAAVVTLGGCTASFVSPEGLLLTNHHCAYGAIQLNSAPDRNLMREGFKAGNRGEELRSPSGSRVQVFDSAEDVTARVLAALSAAPDGIGRARALEAAETRLVTSCERAAGYRCRLYSFAGGSRYVLQRNLELRDIRLVYAPPDSIGNFGGEDDTGSWPRHTADFAFFRAYVAADGRPADHSEANVPFRPRHWLRWAQRPLGEGDGVVAIGFPGSTDRHALAVDLQRVAEWTFPEVSRHYRNLAAVVEARAAGDADIALRYAGAVAGWKQTARSYDDQLEDFARLDAISRRRAEEAEVLEWLGQQGQMGLDALSAHQQLVRSAEAAHALQPRDLVLGQLHRTGTLGLAMLLYRNAIERGRPDAEREPGYQLRDQPQIEAQLAQFDRRHHPDADSALLEYWFRQHAQLPEALQLPAINAWLGQADDAIEAMSARLAVSQWRYPEARVHWLTASRSEFESSRDPLIAYVVAVTPALMRQELERKAHAGDVLSARAAWVQALEAFKAGQGRPFHHDANASLRITSGQVRGHVSPDGARHEAVSLIDQIPPRVTFRAPFDPPQAMLDAIAERRHGGLQDPGTRTVPVNFLADLDVTGGNSGSPVLDVDGRLTGLVFDMNRGAASANWLFNADQTRAIAVDQRYLRWILQIGWPAPELLRELELAPSDELQGQ